MSSVWSALSAVSVNDHTEQKGEFTYLGWTYAWAEVKSRYPDATYTIEPENVMADGSMEVRTTVTIDGQTLPMWLAVTNFSNKPIQNPDCASVANARMRCLTKNLAMFGLGFYLYAGESMPMEPVATEEDWQTLKRIVGSGEAMALRQFSDRVGPEVMTALFNNAETGKKTEFKNQVRELYKKAKSEIDAYVAAILQHRENQDDAGVMEVWEELTDGERFYVKKQMSETDAQWLEDLTNER